MAGGMLGVLCPPWDRAGWATPKAGKPQRAQTPKSTNPKEYKPQTGQRGRGGAALALHSPDRDEIRNPAGYLSWVGSGRDGIRNPAGLDRDGMRNPAGFLSQEGSGRDGIRNPSASLFRVGSLPCKASWSHCHAPKLPKSHPRGCFIDFLAFMACQGVIPEPCGWTWI